MQCKQGSSHHCLERKILFMKRIPISLMNAYPNTVHDSNDIAEIYRDKENKKTFLNISTQKEWILYSGFKVETIDFTTPLLKQKGGGKFELDVPTSQRSYFALRIDGHTITLAEKHLPMKGAYNLRDLGGYETADGHRTKWGKLFRSDGLDSLENKDIEYLASIPILTIVDLRTDEESAKEPDKKIPTTIKKYHYHVEPDILREIDSLYLAKESVLNKEMTEMYKVFVTDKEVINTYKKLFALLQDEKNSPLLFHCTSGKDRTGIGAAFTLFALGVDEKTIMEDYLLSNIYLVERYGDKASKHPNLKPVLGVKEKFLNAAIQQIKKDHGSVNNYLEKVLDVDIQAFRKKYLE